MTSLINVAPPKILAQMALGDGVTLEVDERRLNVMNPASNDQLGQVEARMASRLKRLITGGNKYEATVKSADDREMTIIIRETYKHPSQVGIISFPSKATPWAYIPNSVLGYELGQCDSAAEAKRIKNAKDWSNDDTELGDDQAFTPVLHRIINSSGENTGEEF